MFLDISTKHKHSQGILPCKYISKWSFCTEKPKNHFETILLYYLFDSLCSSSVISPCFLQPLKAIPDYYLDVKKTTWSVKHSFLMNCFVDSTKSSILFCFVNMFIKILKFKTLFVHFWGPCCCSGSVRNECGWATAFKYELSFVNKCFTTVQLESALFM